MDKKDAKGNVTQAHYGNNVNLKREYHTTRNYLKSINSKRYTATIQNLSYTMDAIGNLEQRRDGRMGTQEYFTYDNLNRLKKSTTNPATPDSVVVDYDYDALGNLTYRSDVGTLEYGDRGYGPHAVTTVNRTDATSTKDIFSPYAWYRYDANGNLLQNKDRRVDWTSFNKPARLTAVVGGDARGASYSYGSDFQRITKTKLNGTKTTRYYGGGSSERISESNKTYWKYYIGLGKTTLEYKVEQTGTNNYQEREYQYLFKDHLGSTDVIVKNDGTIKQRLSFNPWGERRDANWTKADNEITSSSNRGFTGHEMDDEIGLVNMKARIYDPVIGRFLSPDSNIPRPNDLQSYNRYSYVRNNPLSFTDPTGHMGKPTVSVRYNRVRYVRGYNGKDNEVYGYRTIKIVTITEPGASGGSRNRSGAASNSVKHYNRGKGNNSASNNEQHADFTQIIYHSKAGTLTLFGKENKKKDFDLYYAGFKKTPNGEYSSKDEISSTVQTGFGNRYGEYGPSYHGPFDNLGEFEDDLELIDNGITPVGIPTPGKIAVTGIQLIGTLLDNGRRINDRKDLERFLSDLEEVREVLSTNITEVDRFENDLPNLLDQNGGGPDANEEGFGDGSLEDGAENDVAGFAKRPIDSI